MNEENLWNDMKIMALDTLEYFVQGVVIVLLSPFILLLFIVASILDWVSRKYYGDK